MKNAWLEIVLRLLAAALVMTSSSVSRGQTPVINGGLPNVSPDGSRIAFISNRGGTPDLFVVATNGTRECS
jgi:Tol biopolymer transport system component